MKLHLLAASHRPDSLNKQLVTIAGQIMQELHPTLTVVHPPYDSYDLPIYNDAERIAHGVPPALQSIITHCTEADIMIWSLPEYNWSYPASLKNMIDWLSCVKPSPLRGIPIFLMCASPSERGGIMALTHLKTVLDYMGMLVYPLNFSLGKAEQRLQDGILAADKYALLQQQLKDFSEFSHKFVEK